MQPEANAIDKFADFHIINNDQVGPLQSFRTSNQLLRPIKSFMDLYIDDAVL